MIYSTHTGNAAVPYNQLVRFKNTSAAKDFFGRTPAVPLYTISQRYIRNLRPGADCFAVNLITKTQLQQPTRNAAGVSLVTPIRIWYYPEVNEYLYKTEGPPPGGASDFYRVWDRIQLMHQSHHGRGRSNCNDRCDQIAYFKLEEQVVDPFIIEDGSQAIADGTPYMHFTGPDGKTNVTHAMTRDQHNAMQTAEAQAAEPLIIRPEPIDVRTIVQATKHVERNQMPHSASGRTQTSKRRRRAARKVKH